MKKIALIVFSLFSIFSILNSPLALAAPSELELEAMKQLGAAAGAEGANLSGGQTDIRLVVARIIRVALGLLGTIFIVLSMYAGFLWMTAGGEEEKTSKAKKLLSNGVIGLAIILSAYAISYFVFKSLLCATTNGSPFGCGGGNPGYYIAPGENPSEWYTGQPPSQ